MIITKIRDGEYKASYKDYFAYGYTAVQAIMNCITLAFE